MSGTNTDSVIWVAGEAAGKNGRGGTAAIPTPFYPPFYQATNTTVPTGTSTNGNVHITSASGVYLYNGSDWVGPFVAA